MQAWSEEVLEKIVNKYQYENTIKITCLYSVFFVHQLRYSSEKNSCRDNRKKNAKTKKRKREIQ